MNVIAIDGPAASGKSTVAKLLAEKLQIPYINTGNMYRAITYHMLQNELDINKLSSEELNDILSNIDLTYKRDGSTYKIFLNSKSIENEIRKPNIAKNVSAIAANPSVRTFLTVKQREFTELGLIVMEGRDIGTVVFPEANYKFFVTASPIVRAKRRLAQDGETFSNSTLESVAKEIEERDKQDSERAVAPLKQADDAILIDTSEMSIDQVLDFIIQKVK